MLRKTTLLVERPYKILWCGGACAVVVCLGLSRNTPLNRPQPRKAFLSLCWIADVFKSKGRKLDGTELLNTGLYLTPGSASLDGGNPISKKCTGPVYCPLFKNVFLNAATVMRLLAGVIICSLSVHPIRWRTNFVWRTLSLCHAAQPFFGKILLFPNDVKSWIFLPFFCSRLSY